MTETIAVEAILTGFAFIAVVFRFFSRLHVRKGLMADDYAMFFAMVNSQNPCACDCSNANQTAA